MRKATMIGIIFLDFIDHEIRRQEIVLSIAYFRHQLKKKKLR